MEQKTIQRVSPINRTEEDKNITDVSRRLHDVRPFVLRFNSALAARSNWITDAFGNLV